VRRLGEYWFPLASLIRQEPVLLLILAVISRIVVDLAGLVGRRATNTHVGYCGFGRLTRARIRGIK